MKLSNLQPMAFSGNAAPAPGSGRGAAGFSRRSSLVTRHSSLGFTMIEIAICLAIIGVALVGIIGVLPYGLGTQRDTREETVVGQDANLLIELIRNGSRGGNDLTNYVYQITNSVTDYNDNGTPGVTHVYGYTYAASFQDGTLISHLNDINNGTNIIGLLSAPEFYTNVVGKPGFYHPIPNVYQGGYSNHITAYIHAISGLAAEQPPQDSQILRDDSFTYRLYVANASIAQDTNTLGLAYNMNLATTLHDLRLTFQWPVLPFGKLGSGHLTFRASVAGDLREDPLTGLFFYSPQTFTTTP